MTRPPPQFGRYLLRELLGRGGFAEVYRATDPALGREVALKALLPHLAGDASIQRRFLAEARTLASLRHQNIVTVHDVGEAEGRPFFAMELIPGQSLDHWLASQQPWTLETAGRVIRPVAAALDALHAAGLVHRDVKPANVMLEAGGRVVLMDLGIVRALGGTQHTETGASLGTPSYMAPEQVRGQPAGPAADIYALGVLTFHLLTGTPPFAGDTAHVLHAQAYESPPLERLPADLPPSVRPALAAALAKEPVDRPASATAFAAALAGLARPFSPGPREGTTPPDRGALPATIASIPSGTRPGRSRLPLLVGAVAAALLLAAMGVVAITATRGSGSTRNNDRPATSVAVTVTTAGTPVVAQASARPVVESVSSTTTPAATAASSLPARVSPVVTAAPPMTVSNFHVESSDAWARGQSNLQGCFSFTSAPGGSGVRLRVVSASDPATPLVDGPLTALGAANGGPVCTAAPPAAVRDGNYVALLYDAGWQKLNEFSFAVQPPTQAPGTTETIGVQADDPQCCLVTVQRVQKLGDGGLALSLSFTMHATGWDSDNTAAARAGIYLLDEQGRRLDVLDVTGAAASTDKQATSVDGVYRFGAPSPGSSWVWLHYATNTTYDRSLVIGIGLGAIATQGSTTVQPIAAQQIGAAVLGAGDDSLGKGVRLAVVRGESLGGGTIRLLLSFSYTDPLKWTSDNSGQNRGNVYVDDGQGHRAALSEVIGPGAFDESSALAISGWYRFAPLPAGTRQLQLHYGSATVSFDLGAAAVR